MKDAITPLPNKKILVVGGGAAGFFGALRIAELLKGAEIEIAEAGKETLRKVRISGGGRCNVTHACFEPRELATRYPRGERELLSLFHRFQPRDTIEWFSKRGVTLKTETDGRMFPITNDSETIINCLEREADRLQVRCNLLTKVQKLESCADKISATIKNNAQIFDAVLLATGSSRDGHQLAVNLGHSIEPLAPSIFTFKIADPALWELSGLSSSFVAAEIQIGAAKFQAQGPMLITHWGLSGPAILRLSAWAARELQSSGYKASLRINWLAKPNIAKDLLQQSRKKISAKLVRSGPAENCGIPERLWRYLVTKAEIPETLRWGQLSKILEEKLAQTLEADEQLISGKGEFKEEFVTCGGVKRSEIDFRTMRSKLGPPLFFAGEAIDIDGITGGFNFQNAWSTSFVAGTAIADLLQHHAL